MIRFLLAAAAALLLLTFGTDNASARHYKYRAYAFRTGHCKRPSCFRKHPGGRYVYPLTHRRHR